MTKHGDIYSELEKQNVHSENENCIAHRIANTLGDKLILLDCGNKEIINLLREMNPELNFQKSETKASDITEIYN